jgi:hypothetical protein
MFPEMMPGIAPIVYGSPDYSVLRDLANDPEYLTKALTTGSGVVAADASGGQALRMQFLHNVLAQVSHDQEDAVGFKLLPVEKVWSTTFEWTQFKEYGGAGDGFTGESGTDGSFGLSSSDDTFIRRLMTVKYMYAHRTTGFVAQQVRNIENPVKSQENGATLEIIGKAGMALYGGDSKLSVWQFDGLKRQIWDWVSSYADDQAIMYDAGGAPLDEVLLNEIAQINRTRFGRGDVLLQSVQGYADTTKLLYPKERGVMGATGAFGLDASVFASDFGRIKRYDDPMLRPNWPVIPDGTGSSGKPRTSADSGSKAVAATPFNAVAAGSPSSTAWHACISTNAAAASGTNPALPSGDGSQGNRLAAGTYYYAVSLVYRGLEGLPWVYGKTAAGLGGAGAATGVAVTAGQVVKFTLDTTGTQFTDITSSNANQYKVRLYRASSASTDANDWGLLYEFGLPNATSTVTYDNGMFIPGYDNAFLITTKKRGVKGIFMGELLPLIKRELPPLAMADPFVMLWFGCLILLAARHHVWVRNIGPGPRPG